MEYPTFTFKTNDHVNGIIIELIDNDPYNKITVDIWFEYLYLGSYNIPHIFDTNNGSTISFFKAYFKPFKTTKTIKIIIKTKLQYVDLITMKLLIDKSI